MKSVCVVTGCTGQVGLNLVDELLKQEIFSKVICLHRQNSRLNFLNQIKEKYKESKSVIEFVIGNVTDMESLKKAIPEKCDCVFHLAGVIGHLKMLEKAQIQVNHFGVKNICDVCIEKNVVKLVHVSSVAAYFGRKINIKDEYVFDENSPKNGGESKIVYNRSKYLGEMEVIEATKKGLNASIINPGVMTGEYDIRGLTPTVKAVYRKQTLKFTGGKVSIPDSVEVAKALIRCCEVGKKGESYFLGGNQMDLCDFSNLVAKEFNRKKRYKRDGYKSSYFLAGLVEFYHRYVLCGKMTPISRELIFMSSLKWNIDSSKAIKELDYKQTPIEELIKRNIAFLKQNGMLERKKKAKKNGKSRKGYKKIKS